MGGWLLGCRLLVRWGWGCLFDLFAFFLKGGGV